VVWGDAGELAGVYHIRKKNVPVMRWAWWQAKIALFLVVEQTGAVYLLLTQFRSYGAFHVERDGDCPTTTTELHLGHRQKIQRTQ